MNNPHSTPYRARAVPTPTALSSTHLKHSSSAHESAKIKMSDLIPVVIDNGTSSMKVGFAGEDSPIGDFSSVVGKPKHYDVMRNLRKGKDAYVGHEAQQLRSMLQLKYPIQHGVIQDWDGMEKIWSHAFENELKVDPEEHPVLLTEAPMNPKAHGARMAQIMFETFNVPGLQIQSSAPLSLYSMGLNTGLVISSGDGVTNVVPVYEGYSIPHAVVRLPLAGRDVTDHLIHMMGESGFQFTTTAEREIAREIKEGMCYVTQDYSQELKNLPTNESLVMSCHHPNGSVMNLGRERFTCPEILFQPTLMNLDFPGLHQCIHQCITKCDIDLRRDLYSSIVLSGGTTMFEGFADRISLELRRLAPASMYINVHAQPDRRNSAWVGGSVFASLPQFWDTLVMKAEYEEYGAAIIHERLLAAAI